MNDPHRATLEEAERLAERGELEAAEHLLTELSRSSSSDPRLWSDLGVVRFERGDVAGALDALRRAYELDVRREDTVANLVEVLRRLGLEEDAGRVRDAWEAVTGGADALVPETGREGAEMEEDEVERAEALAEEGLLEEAGRLLERRVEGDPGDRRAWNDLGAVRFQLGDLSGALDALRRAYEIDTSHPDTVANLCEVLERLGHAEDAARVRNAALPPDGGRADDLEARLEEAERRAEAGDTSSAEELLAGLASGHPQVRQVWNDLGVVRFLRGDLPAALDALCRAYELEPGHPDTSANLVEVLTRMGYHDEAEQVRDSAGAGGRVTPPGESAGTAAGPEPGGGEGVAHPMAAPAGAAVPEPEAGAPREAGGRRYRISALVSTYASEEFIAECLDNLLSQTVADQIEIIVVDAASPEREGEIVREYQKHHDNIRYIRTAERIGIYAAWNVAIREARGEYLISASTNDILAEDACERLMKVLDEDPQAMLTYGTVLLTPNPHENFERYSLHGTYIWKPYSLQNHLQEWQGGPHPMWRRSVHDEVGLFDESYDALGDQDMWFRIGERFKVVPISHITSLQWITPESLSGNSGRAGREGRRVRRRYSARFSYRIWRRLYGLDLIDAEVSAERMQTLWKSRPTWHLVMWAEAGDESAVSATIASLGEQLYRGWRLTILSRTLAGGARDGDERISWRRVAADTGRSEALSEAVSAARGDWVAMIEPGMRFEPNLTARLTDYIHLHPAWRLVYLDDDVIEGSGEAQSPRFKPDFNYDMLLAQDYLGVCFIERRALESAGGFGDLPGAEGYAVALRLCESLGESVIGHLDEPLIHYPREMDLEATEDVRRALVEGHLERRGVKARVKAGLVPGTLRVEWQHDGPDPMVSIIIPTRDAMHLMEPCLDSVLEKTRYSNYEVIVVDNQSRDPELLRWLEEKVAGNPGRVRVIRYDHPFNYSAISNLAAREARGDYLVLLNNDTVVLQERWLENMLLHARRPDVGVVGVRLTLPESGIIQHAGVVLGFHGAAGHPHGAEYHFDEPGPLNRLQVDQEYSAVTAACMMVSRRLWHELGGMDERDFAVCFNDVDFCLRAREAGYRVVWTPWVTLIHKGSQTLLPKSGADRLKRELRGESIRKEARAFRRKWAKILARDPGYNRHLSLAAEDVRVESSMVCNWDPQFHERPRLLGVPAGGGCAEYRIWVPFRALARNGYAHVGYSFVNEPHAQRLPMLEELFRVDPDTIVLQNSVSDQHLEFAEKVSDQLGIPLVFSLDDLLTDLPEGNSSRRAVPPDVKARIRRLLGSCERAVVSTEPLREFLSSMIDDVRVAPNCLENEVWEPLTSRRGVSARPRVGWAGAQQHSGDLALIVEVVKRTAKEVDWVFFGMCPKELRGVVREIHDFELDFRGYAEKLASLDLDLAIAPLEIHPFNEAKSNLRLLEYGVLGWPVVCTDILPYRGAPVKRVPNRVEAWVEAIRERVHDLDAAWAEGDRLRQWVRENYMMDGNVRVWADAYLPAPGLSREAGLRRAAG